MQEAAQLRRKTKQYIDRADTTTLRMVHALLEAQQEADWWDLLPNGAQSSINQGLKEARAGLTVPHHQAMKEFRKWQSK